MKKIALLILVLFTIACKKDEQSKLTSVSNVNKLKSVSYLNRLLSQSIKSTFVYNNEGNIARIDIGSVWLGLSHMNYYYQDGRLTRITHYSDSKNGGYITLADVKLSYTNLPGRNSELSEMDILSSYGSKYCHTKYNFGYNGIFNKDGLAVPENYHFSRKYDDSPTSESSDYKLILNDEGNISQSKELYTNHDYTYDSVPNPVYRLLILTLNEAPFQGIGFGSSSGDLAESPIGNLFLRPSDFPPLDASGKNGFNYEKYTFDVLAYFSANNRTLESIVDSSGLHSSIYNQYTYGTNNKPEKSVSDYKSQIPIFSNSEISYEYW